MSDKYQREFERGGGGIDGKIGRKRIMWASLGGFRILIVM